MPEPLKHTSVYEIIDRFQTNLDIGNEPLRVSDIIGWIGEALKKIGASPMFKPRITGINDGSYPSPILQINDYRSTLPCDIYSLLAVGVGSTITGPFQYCIKSTGDLDIVRGDLSSLTENTANTYPPGTDDKIQFVADVFGESYSDAFIRLNATPSLNNLLNVIFVNSNYVTGSTDGMYYDNVYKYNINTPYIEFNVRTGYAILAYKAIALNKDGYPLIPDEEDLKEAIYWYINMKYSYPLWRNGQVRDLIYMDAAKNWGKYSKKAYGNIMMPDAAEMTTVANIWLRQIPVIGEYESYFKYLGEQQKIYNS